MINKTLTTHVARHSYATSVCLANGVSIENVAKMLGHSNIKMTQHYVEKAREFDPFWHAELTPSGIIRLPPVDDTAGEFFCSFENPCPGTAGFNVKYYKI